MESFKKNLIRNQIFLLLFAILITAIYFILLVVEKNIQVIKDSHFIDFFDGFRTGIYGAILGIIIFVFSKNLIIINNEEKLRRKYIEFTDERKRNIIYKSAIMQLRITIILSLLGTIIAGFFNVYVFFTLLIVELISGYGFIIIRNIYSKII